MKRLRGLLKSEERKGTKVAMSLVEAIEEEKRIHQRILDMSTYALDDEKIVVQGFLRDERFSPIYEFSGEKREKGVIHHMILRLLVGGVPLRILDAEAEMPHVPLALCATTLESVKRVVGLEIKSGFGERVHKLIGGVEGCAHLTHLLTAMAQEVIHGYWTHKMRKPGPRPRSLEEIDGLSFLVDSCSLWREEGPIMQGIKDFLKGRSASS